MTTAPITHAHDDPIGAMALDFPEEPTAPFGVIALPGLAAPVTEWGLRLAHTAMLAHFKVAATAAERTKDVRPVGAQLDKALALTLDRSRWTIHTEHVEVIGSQGDLYKVTPAFCEGSAWSNKKGRVSKACRGATRAAVGMCTHQIAIEYLRLAQELDPPVRALTDADPAPTTAAAPAAASTPGLVEIASAELVGWDVYAMLGRLRIKQRREPGDVDIFFSADDGMLTLSSGAYGATGPATIAGSAYASLSPDEFEELWSGIGDGAKDIPTLTLTVQVDGQNDGMLTVQGGAIDLAVAVRAMSC